jgi:fucose permease
MIQPTDTQPEQSKHGSRIHILLAFLAFLLIGCNDGAIGVLLPSIRIFYRVDTATVSWLFVLSASGYLVASFNNGLLLEKLGVRHFLLLALVLFLIAALLIYLNPYFRLYLCLAFLLGFSIAMLDSGLNTYIAVLPDNATLLNYLHAFYGVGALLGPLVASSLLALRLGWQSIYIVWFCLALGLLLSFGFAFKIPRSGKQASSQQQGNVLLETLHRRAVWIAALFLLFYVGTEVSLGSWSYSFLTVARSEPDLVSALAVSGYWCGLTLGRFVLANLASRLGVRRLITLCLSGVIPGLLMAWFLPGLWGAVLGLSLTGFCLGPLFPTVIALMPQLVSARLVPGAIGFLASLGSVGGALFPWLAGTFSQHLGFWFLLPYTLVLTLAMFGFWFVLSRQPAQQ